MTDHFKRQEQADQNPEIKMCCYDRIKNYISIVVIDEIIAACAHNKDDNEQNKDKLKGVAKKTWCFIFFTLAYFSSKKMIDIQFHC